ncbi:MAG: cell division protein FtsQ/DivIB [Actinomycetes bacterium]
MTPRVDPRIAARRGEVARVAARRRAVVLAVVVCAAALGGLTYALIRSSLLEARQVRVEGVTGARADAVSQFAGVEPGQPLVLLDTGAVARRVERLPWVGAVTVSRGLPHTVRITVVQRDAVAWARRAPAATTSTTTSVPDGARATGATGASSTTSSTTTTTTVAVPAGPPRLIDRSGRVLATTAAPPPGLPELRGVRVPEAGRRITPAGAARAVAAIPADLRRQVVALEVDPRTRDLVLLLATQPKVRPTARRIVLGDATRARAKGEVALTVLGALTSARQSVTTIDVSVPTAPATS